MFVIVWLMFCGWRGAATLAFSLFVISAIGDWLDGYLARMQKTVTDFGKFMDALTDKILMIGTMVALVAKFGIVLDNNDAGKRHLVIFFLVLVLLTLCREFLVSGMRMVAASKGVVIAAERSGKIKTVVQLVAMSFILLVPMLETDWLAQLPPVVAENLNALHIFGLALFVIATALTVSSGISYMLKYHKVFEEGAFKG